MAASPGLVQLLDLPVVQNLLQCDACVYGNTLREAFAPGTDMRVYLQDHAIVAYGYRKFQDLIERTLYPYCVHGPETVDVKADYTACKYVVRLALGGGHDDAQVTLHMSYVSDFRATVGIVGSVLDFDVSLLELNRTGLHLRVVPAQLRMHPCPLQRVLGACDRRTFHVINEPRDEGHEEFLLRRIDRLCNRGWTHGTCVVTQCEEPHEDGCAICIADGDGDWVRLDRCGHMFHMRCFAQHCVTTTRRQPIYPRVARCPMCRRITKSYELAPVVMLTA